MDNEWLTPKQTMELLRIKSPQKFQSAFKEMYQLGLNVMWIGKERMTTTSALKDYVRIKTAEKLGITGDCNENHQN